MMAETRKPLKPYKRLWAAYLPPSFDPSYDSGVLHRPEADLPMFADVYNNNFSTKFKNKQDGKQVEFRTTLTGSDNKFDLPGVWSQPVYGLDTFGKLQADCKNDHYISCHFGTVPNLYTLDEIKAAKQHILPSYIGIRFQYRYPNDNSRNFWSNSPVYISKLMTHYYNAGADDVWSYNLSLYRCSTSNEHLYPSRFVDDNARRDDVWKGAYYQPRLEESIKTIRDRQLIMFGLSIEMCYVKNGGASHNGCMDIRNLTPIWSPTPGTRFRPVMTKPAAYNWGTATKAKPGPESVEVYLQDVT